MQVSGVKHAVENNKCEALCKTAETKKNELWKFLDNTVNHRFNRKMTKIALVKVMRKAHDLCCKSWESHTISLPLQLLNGWAPWPWGNNNKSQQDLLDIWIPGVSLWRNTPQSMLLLLLLLLPMLLPLSLLMLLQLLLLLLSLSYYRFE